MANSPQAVAQHAQNMRINIIKMLEAAGSGHPGGSLSAADIVASLYFGGIANLDLEAPGRDRFILAKGHAAPVLYAALAEQGIIPEEELLTLRQLGSRLQGHPDSKKLPGVEVSTGSLGQGLSIAAGLAHGLALNAPGQAPTVYTLMGDGEIEEGQVWEAAMFAAHLQLKNLIAIVDANGLQIDGNVEDVAGLNKIAAKFQAFGWSTIECDGHDIPAILTTLAAAKSMDAPVCIVAKTVKGKGVSFMENKAGWHGKAPSAEEAAQAIEELKGAM